jgi:hypothetical protein
MSRKLCVAVLGLILAWPSTVLGSGSYSYRPSRGASGVDMAVYHRGKQIFTGQARLDNGASPIPASHQEECLSKLQALLPQQARGSANLPQLAGKLSADQFKALEYYLGVRYRIKATPC